MEDLKNIYKQRFFSGRDSLAWRAPIIAEAIRNIFLPKSVIDVGCAIGDVVKALNKYNDILAHGIEGSPEAIPYFVCNPQKIKIHDLRKPLPHSWIIFDFVLSLEVAEHIEPEYANVYVENLCSLGKRILISAAPPGQKGHYHVNCQPKEYWESKFKDYGFVRDITVEGLWRSALSNWKTKKEMTAYINNVLFFCKPEI